MMMSCSTWMVATMSRIDPVRPRLTSASNGSGTYRAGFNRTWLSQVFVENVDDLARLDQETSAQLEPHGVGHSGAVERHGDRSSPVDY